MRRRHYTLKENLASLLIGLVIGGLAAAGHAKSTSNYQRYGVATIKTIKTIETETQPCAHVFYGGADNAR